MTRLALALAVLASPASAACTDHATLTAELSSRWGETLTGIGIAGNGVVLETFANPETGTWTIAVTQPGGPSCIVASGEAWEPGAVEPEGEGA